METIPQILIRFQTKILILILQFSEYNNSLFKMETTPQILIRFQTKILILILILLTNIKVAILKPTAYSLPKKWKRNKIPEHVTLWARTESGQGGWKVSRTEPNQLIKRMVCKKAVGSFEEPSRIN